jgi:hypothetical protein
MKTPTNQKSKAKEATLFEDLYDDNFSSMQWNPGTLLKAMPKQNIRIKKMKSR